MFLIKTNKYSIKQNKLGFIDLYNKDDKKVKHLGHKLFLDQLIYCDENNFIITFLKLYYNVIHYDLNKDNYIANQFKYLKLIPNVTILNLKDNIIKITSYNNGSFTILYNWQTKKYYKNKNIDIKLDNQNEVIASKKIKYDNEIEGLYFEDMLHYNLDSNNFEIKKAYSELQQRNIDFENKNAKKVIKRECLENMRTLAILQKENLLKTRDEYNKEQSLTRTKH